MSLSYEKLKAVQVKDPRCDIQQQREYAILRSGAQVSNKVFTTTSISTSSIQFSCPPPSTSVIIDRKLMVTLPIRFTFTGPGTNAINLLQAARDALRSFPISSSIETLKVSINNSSVSINMSDVIQPLLHFNTDLKLKKSDYSQTPSYSDQTQQYADLVGSIRNPLGFYGDSNDEVNQGRAGFPMTIISNTPTSAVVDVLVTEPLFLSPLYWGLDNSAGFVNVNTFDLDFTFVSNQGNRMWSHDNSLGTNVISGIQVQYSGFATAFSYSVSQPTMLFTYITPNEMQIIPKNEPVTYSYFDIQRFPTDFGNIAAGDLKTISSNNIQLNSIPRRMYIFARNSNAILNSSPNNTDSFLSIEKISINFNNYQGLLSQSSKAQLYAMSVKNHCNLSWAQWSAEPVYQTGSLTAQIAGLGSILCVEFGSDIGLDDLSAPGLIGNYQLQMDVNFMNKGTQTVNATMYIIVVNEGTFTIVSQGNAVNQIGVISKADILDSHQLPYVNYRDVQHVNGGNFLSGLKDFGMKLLNFARENKLISKGLSQIPHPLAQTASRVADLVGYGEGYRKKRKRGGDGGDFDEGCGEGVLVGGKRMSRADLRKRLMKKY